MGRNNLPREIKVSKGTLKKCRDNPDAPKFETIKEIPLHPKGFNERTIDVWNDTCEQLKAAGLLKKLDLRSLEIYVYNVTVIEDCREYMQENGIISIMQNARGGKYPVKSPYWIIYNEACANLLKVADRFGLTPIARNKVKSDKKKEENPLDKLLHKMA